MAHTYSQFLVETVNGQTVQIPAAEILRIMASGVFRDGTEWDGLKIAGEITVDEINIGDIDANMQVGGVDVSAANPVPVDATGQGDVPVTLDGEAVGLSGNLPDTAAGDLAAIAAALAGTLAAELSGSLPDTATGDLAAVAAALAATLTVDATGQGDVPITLDGETVAVTSRPASSSNVHFPAANTAAVVTKGAPGEGVKHVLGGIYWSYNDTPSGGSVSVVDGSTSVFSEGVTSGGPGYFPFQPPMSLTENAQMIVTLAAGGAGVTGRLNLHAWTE
jgi:hypothetical protein